VDVQSCAHNVTKITAISLRWILRQYGNYICDKLIAIARFDRSEVEHSAWDQKVQRVHNGAKGGKHGLLMDVERAGILRCTEPVVDCSELQ
jgi:hypothetical protein